MQTIINIAEAISFFTPRKVAELFSIELIEVYDIMESIDEEENYVTLSEDLTRAYGKRKVKI